MGSFILERVMWDTTGANPSLWGGMLQDSALVIKDVTTHCTLSTVRKQEKKDQKGKCLHQEAFRLLNWSCKWRSWESYRVSRDSDLPSGHFWGGIWGWCFSIHLKGESNSVHRQLKQELVCVTRLKDRGSHRATLLQDRFDFRSQGCESTEWFICLSGRRAILISC